MNWFCVHRYVACVRVLLAAGADANPNDDNGRTPLHAAVTQGFVECVEALLTAGGDVNVPACGRPGGERQLLADNACLSDNNGCTAPHAAAGRGPVECVLALLAVNADLNVALPNGSTPLHATVSGRHTECMKALVAADANGCTPLYVAAADGAEEFVKALIASGSDVNLATNTGATPPHVAAWRRHVQCMRALHASCS